MRQKIKCNTHLLIQQAEWYRAKSFPFDMHYLGRLEGDLSSQILRDCMSLSNAK